MNLKALCISYKEHGDIHNILYFALKNKHLYHNVPMVLSTENHNKHNVTFRSKALFVSLFLKSYSWV